MVYVRTHVVDPEVVGRIKEVADEEEGLEPAAGLLLRHALPALPLLLLGLVAQEGDKILDHELNVPAATVLLLSCVTYTASACLSTYLTAAAVPPEAQLALTSLALAATIGIEAYEDRRSTSVVAILTALTGVGCSYGFHWLRLAGSLGGSGGLPLLRPAATSFAGLP